MCVVKKHILDINEDAMQLDERRRKVFQSVTENLLYVTKIALPNLDPTFFYVQEYKN